jgi:TRAP-type C4-dicarboxylate transport system substrate-binding protein
MTAGSMTLGLSMLAGTGRADELPFVHFKVLGSLSQTSHYRDFEEPFWATRLAADSGGRVTADVAPFDKAGLTASEALQMTRLGVISFLTVQVGLVAAEDPEANAADLPGVNRTLEDTKIAAAAWEPTLKRVFDERYGLDVLAIMGYPAQIISCVDKLTSLRDLAGRTVRTSTVAQTSFVEALGARGVLLPLGDTIQALASGSVDCAVTGAMTGNLMGLPKFAHYLYTAPISWGMELVLANHKTWIGLDPAMRKFLVDELQQLELETWRSSATATHDGIACDAGPVDCVAGAPGDMVLVPSSPADEAMIRALLADKLLPKWADRCGPECADDWNRLIGRRLGLTATTAR